MQGNSADNFTDTDMEITVLANEDKLVSEGKQWHYKGSNTEEPQIQESESENKNFQFNDNNATVGNNIPDMNNYLKDNNVSNNNDTINQTMNQTMNHTDNHNNEEPESTKLDDEAQKEVKRFKNIQNKATKNFENLPDEEKMIRKLHLIRKLGELSKKGVKVSQNYNINSDYSMMRYELELHNLIRKKQKTVNMLHSALFFLVNQIEELDQYYEYVGLNLRGWQEKLIEHDNFIKESLEEIYELHFPEGSGESNPYLSLLLVLGISAADCHNENVGNKKASSLGKKMFNFYKGDPDEKNIDKISNNDKLEYAKQLQQYKEKYKNDIEEHQKRKEQENKKLDALKRMRDQLHNENTEDTDIPFAEQEIDYSNVNQETAEKLRNHKEQIQQKKNNKYKSNKNDVHSDTEGSTGSKSSKVNKQLDDAIRRSSIHSDSISVGSSRKSRSKKSNKSGKTINSKYGNISIS